MVAYGIDFSETCVVDQQILRSVVNNFEVFVTLAWNVMVNMFKENVADVTLRGFGLGIQTGNVARLLTGRLSKIFL